LRRPTTNDGGGNGGNLFDLNLVFHGTSGRDQWS
jgi:hypothetical protein